MQVTASDFVKHNQFVLWVDKEGLPIARFRSISALVCYKSHYDFYDETYYIDEIDWMKKFHKSQHHIRVHDFVSKDAVWNNRKSRLVIWSEEGEILHIATDYSTYNAYMKHLLAGRKIYALSNVDQYHYKFESTKLSPGDAAIYYNARNQAHFRPTEFGKIFVSCHLTFHPILDGTGHHLRLGSLENVFRVSAEACHNVTYLPPRLLLERSSILNHLAKNDVTYEALADAFKSIKYEPIFYNALTSDDLELLRTNRQLLL